MKSDLHKIADEKVNVYEENARFQDLLNQYYKGNDGVYNELWTISFRASCNLLKKRFGKIYSWNKIEDVALDMLTILFTRINNRKKWPDGYKILNLPTVLNNIILNVVYGPKAKERDEIVEVSLDALKEKGYELSCYEDYE